MHLYAGLVSTDEDVVSRFAAIVGVGFVSEVRPRRSHHKHAWRWGANGEDVERVYALLAPWLGERRQARFHELLAERRAYERDRDGRAKRFPRFAFTQGRLPS